MRAACWARRSALDRFRVPSPAAAGFDRIASLSSGFYLDGAGANVSLVTFHAGSGWVNAVWNVAIDTGKVRTRAIQGATRRGGGQRRDGLKYVLHQLEIPNHRPRHRGRWYFCSWQMGFARIVDATRCCKGSYCYKIKRSCGERERGGNEGMEKGGDVD